MGIANKRIASAVLGAAVLGGLLIPGAAMAAPAGGTAVRSPVGIASAQGGSVDIISGTVETGAKIAKIIIDAVAHAQNREGYVKSMVEGTFYEMGQHLNVLVIKDKHPKQVNVNGLAFQGRAHGDGYPDYMIYAFESGHVVNQGDGGYINWGFRGWFDKNGNTVDFRKP
ncbi:hypothetical protein JOF53_007342 [Crossiella equi]|uniref:Stress protein n=1 Tax=Crossiella equi TaxID=130796 RepID=A0ABS5APG8_9PSEU|nr:hypothetical protein [Crossiella equi]MBP2478470.1 hypothetical protein [Crossiella equi]